jgi:hypothetical protein
LDPERKRQAAVQALISAGVKREAARLIADKQLKHRTAEDLIERIDELIGRAYSPRGVKRELAGDLQRLETKPKPSKAWNRAPAANVGDRDRAAARRVESRIRSICGESGYSSGVGQLKLQRVNGRAVYLAPDVETAQRAELYAAELGRLWKQERPELEGVEIHTDQGDT